MWVYRISFSLSFILGDTRFYRQACAQRSHASIVFIQWSKNGFFDPQRRHVAPINVKFDRSAGPLTRAKFRVYRGKNVGTQQWY